MAGLSLQDVRNAAVIAYGLNCIDDVDFACLYDYCHLSPLFPYWKYEKFDLASWDNEECITELRFAEIPEKIVSSVGTVMLWN